MKYEIRAIDDEIILTEFNENGSIKGQVFMAEPDALAIGMKLSDWDHSLVHLPKHIVAVEGVLK